MRFLTAATLHTHSGNAAHGLALCVAANTWTRFRGLMFAPALQATPVMQGLLITRCPSVHGFFLRAAIDVVYLARTQPGNGGKPRHVVTHVAPLAPWRISVGRSLVTSRSGARHVHRSAHALELPPGSIGRLQVRPGDELEIESP